MDAQPGGYDYSLEGDLRSFLFDQGNYQKQTRPETVVQVNLSFSILTFNALDVRNQVLTTTGYFNVIWEDERVSWNKEDKYDSVRLIYADEAVVWRPPLIIDNSVSDISVMSDEAIPIRCSMRGLMIWSPSGIYKTMCETDVTFYPFDTQTCDISISTWGYTDNEIALGITDSEDPLDMDLYRRNGEWEYVSYSVSAYIRGRSKQTFPTINYQVKLRRRPMYHVLNTLTPTILLAFLSCITFKLPPESGERIGYSLTVLLSYAVYLSLVSEHIPRTSVTTSLLSMYLLFILALGMISVLLTIVVLDCHHADEEKEVSTRVMKTANVLMTITFNRKKDHPPLCCHRRVRNKNRKGSNGTLTEPAGNLDKDMKAFEYVKEKRPALHDATWKEIGRILDVCFLRIFLFVVISVTIGFLVTLGIGYTLE
ncbi:acetylcholine receptor subunit delta-like [Argopecten irradians]|uniref:acetylcholine receptor subunit delta-like n=1 Tax=Argopecten irradians TaxID=31199 RepID=UPI00372326BD